MAVAAAAAATAVAAAAIVVAYQLLSCIGDTPHRRTNHRWPAQTDCAGLTLARCIAGWAGTTNKEESAAAACPAQRKPRILAASKLYGFATYIKIVSSKSRIFLKGY